MHKELDQPTALAMRVHYSQPTSYLALVSATFASVFPGVRKIP